MTADASCAHCWGPITWTDASGWVHVDGRGVRWQICDACDWQGSEATSLGACPSCGSNRSLRDLHDAEPRGSHP